ncbi:MAG: aminotransferase class I/II-fold pyridoxal phosphate-dependent enzyme [Oscillatoriophycideae cyanobacterium NC_groundwater_1537_Pr4_S-0.65um_50_18]|nr:aminotransferase class I/II-fold pyridoxal phosphate-dependent enzyme [Oscillatoriophycideae cyanobacterium NC_groundwater_1537_Pr4_S-0.65um_50_18]
MPQTATPLLDALCAAAQAPRAAFHTPGHKKGQGSPASLTNLLGRAVFAADLPELPELDNLFAPSGVIQAAQELAAEAFGADRTWFLANGSTCGIEAAVLATCNPGDKIILPRNSHQSAIAGLILSGAIPVWIEPDSDPVWNVAHGISPAALEAALAQHSEAKAVLVVSPTYYGVCSDLTAIAHLTHHYDLPLLVDEAHGAHFAFHPDLPTPALQAGADLTVQSIHKTLAALTQAAMLHTQGNRVDDDRLSRCLQLVQSTSPNYLLLASLDAARQQMATQGKALLTQTLKLAAIARTHLSQMPGLAVLQTVKAPGFHRLDPTRLTVDVSGWGLTGFEADERLHQTLGVTCELPGLQHLTFILTHGNTAAEIDRLIQAFQTLATQQSPAVALRLPPAPLPSASISPRQAFFSASETVPIATAVGQCSAELICPYPPGIPALFPGEMITAEAIAYLQQILALGGVLTGCADVDLRTLKIVR